MPNRSASSPRPCGWVQRLLILTLLAAAGAVPQRAAGQIPFTNILKGETKPESELPKVDPIAELPEKKADNLKKIGEERQELDAQSASLDAALIGQLTKRLELREEIARYYDQIQEVLQYESELAATRAKLDDSKEAWKLRKPEEGKANFFQLDDLTGDRIIESGRVSSAERDLQLNQSMLEESRANYQKYETARRFAKEKLSLNKDPNAEQALKLDLETAELESQLEEAKILYLQENAKSLKQEKENAEIKRDFLGDEIAWYQQNVRFTEKDLNDKIGQLAVEQGKVGKSLESLRLQLENLKKSYGGTESQPEGDAGVLDPQEIEVRKLAKLNLQIQIQNLTYRLTRIDEIEDLWRRRYAAFNGKVDATRLAQDADYARKGIAQISRGESQVYARLGEARKSLNSVQERLQNMSGMPDDDKKLYYAQKDLIQKIQLNLQDSLVFLYRDKQLYEKFLSEVEPKVNERTFSDRAKIAWSKVLYVWNFELTAIDDKPITVKKLAISIILLLFGFKFARRLSQLMGRRVFPRLGFDTGVAVGLQTLAFYLILVLVTLIVLYFVNVPLTLFTVLGGALAIGVGFGSQTIVKNFISGLILLMERPIRVGDMVDMDGSAGIVERIGARSTVLRSFNNVNILIPNSDFLEKKVVNWTLSDDLARISIGVGVSYESTPKDVIKLMMQAVTEHAQVLKTPEPIVLFSDFGENALQFDAYFWIRMASLMDRKRVESDLRFRIEALFREAGIGFAYPQRDLHLRFDGPLDVAMAEKSSTKAD